MRRYIAAHIHFEQVVGVSGIAEANQIAGRRTVGEAPAEQGVMAVGGLVHLGIGQRDNAGKSLVAANAELIRAEVNVEVREARNLRRWHLTIAIEPGHAVRRSHCSGVEAISNRASIAVDVDAVRARAYLCWCQRAGDLSEGVISSRRGSSTEPSVKFQHPGIVQGG